MGFGGVGPPSQLELQDFACYSFVLLLYLAWGSILAFLFLTTENFNIGADMNSHRGCTLCNSRGADVVHCVSSESPEVKAHCEAESDFRRS